MGITRTRTLSSRMKLAVYSFLGLAIIVGGFVFASAMISHFSSSAEEVGNGIRVAEDTELTYYLKVKYDGVDRQGVESGDDITSEVRSDTIAVSDRIPNGLTFVGFVESEDGSFGAVERGDGTTACAGKVIDDTGDTTGWNAGNTEYVYHGLHYVESTRTVSFRVKNLKGGCQLSIGVKTRTPTLPDGVTRMDFYNFAGVSEGPLSSISNTVHTWIGRGSTDLHKVSYSYTGDIPTGAPALPEDMYYMSESSIGVAADAHLEGYTFSGWSASNVTITNGSFEMPEEDVTLVGTFTAKPKYEVTYSIANNVKPSSYHEPRAKSYGAGDIVDVDDLEVGAIIDGYRFLGWTTTDVTVTDGSFEMPAQSVALVGQFEAVTYTITYAFQGEVLPEGISSRTWLETEAQAGDSITLPANPTADGYQFSGWYKSNPFTMPAEDVTVYGEWSKLTGYFKPEITQTIDDVKEHYYNHDVVKLTIKVKNTAPYAINSVNVSIDLPGAVFTPVRAYTIRTDQLVQVDSIAAGETATIYAEFTIPANENAEFSNTATLLSAVAEGDYQLDTENPDDLKSTVTFNSIKYEPEDPYAGIKNTPIIPFIVLITLGVVGGAVVIVRQKAKQK